MKKFVAALAAAAAFAAFPSFALAAPAADPQTTAAVKAMLEAMETRKMMVSINAEMEKSMPAMMQSQFASMIEGDATLSAAQKKQAQAQLERALPGMLKAMGEIFRDPVVIDEVINEMVRMYAENFTAAEINELAAFYRTPVGRKMIATVPKISAESMAMSQRLIMPRISKIMQAFVQDIQKQ